MTNDVGGAISGFVIRHFHPYTIGRNRPTLSCKRSVI
jgi:hypothetical protein